MIFFSFVTDEGEKITSPNGPKAASLLKLPCHYCGHIFKTSQALKRHIFTHTGEKPYKCGDCSKSFSRKDRLKEHIFRIHMRKF